MAVGFFLLVNAVGFLGEEFLPDFLAFVFLPLRAGVAEDFFVTLVGAILRDPVFLGVVDRRVFLEELFPGMNTTFLLHSGGEGHGRHIKISQKIHNKFGRVTIAFSYQLSKNPHARVFSDLAVHHAEEVKQEGRSCHQ